MKVVLIIFRFEFFTSQTKNDASKEEKNTFAALSLSPGSSSWVCSVPARIPLSLASTRPTMPWIRTL